MSRRQEREQKRKAEERAEDLRWLIGNVRGRRILRDLMGRSRYGEPSFSGNSRDAFELGRQKLVADLVSEIKTIALTEFHRLEIEAQADEKRAEQAQAEPDDEEPDA